MRLLACHFNRKWTQLQVRIKMMVIETLGLGNIFCLPDYIALVADFPGKILLDHCPAAAIQLKMFV